MKNLLFDKTSGEFNWALVAVLALAAIFFYSVLTANVSIPKDSMDNSENIIHQEERDFFETLD